MYALGSGEFGKRSSAMCYIYAQTELQRHWQGELVRERALENQTAMRGNCLGGADFDWREQ